MSGERRRHVDLNVPQWEERRNRPPKVGPKTRNVRVAEGLMETVVEGLNKADPEHHVTWVWGEPDAEGFYTPTLSVTNRIAEIPRVMAMPKAAPKPVAKAKPKRSW